MAFDTWIKFDGIEGEGTASGFEKQTEIYSFSWGASNPTTKGASGRGIGASKVSLSSFNLMKKLDCTSPHLFEKLCKGDHIKLVTVTMRKAGGKQEVFHKLEFETCMIESVQWSGSSGGDDTPTESVSVAFLKVNTGYAKQKKEGGVDGMVTKIWDQARVTNA